MLQPLVALPALFAALIVGTDRRIVRELRLADATTRDRAIDLKSSPIRHIRLRRLVAVGALGMAEQHRYYLDEAGWSRFGRARRARVLFTAALVTLFLAVFWFRAR